MSENKKFRRNALNKVIGGVCSGLADYFNIDVVLVRIIFAASFLFAGVGLGLYLLLWILVPADNYINYWWINKTKTTQKLKSIVFRLFY